jgi:acetyl esterase
VVCQLAKARGGPRVAYQILLYPVVDMTTAVDSYDSRRLFGGGDYLLGRKDIEWLASMYFRSPADGSDPRASPILATDLHGLPPALVITAGFDPLRDEGMRYAERMAAAGVDTEYKCFETTIHGFVSFAGRLPAGREAAALIAAHLKQRLGAR